MNDLEERTTICPRTGLALIGSELTRGFHVGARIYSAFSGPERNYLDKSRRRWGRFDVPGKNYYVAETEECALAEVLSHYKKRNGDLPPLAKDAAAVGLSFKEFIALFERNLSEEEFHGVGVLPSGWRHNRSISTVGYGQRSWLVRIDHPETLAALDRLHGEELAALGVEQVTSATVAGENRDVTTSVAHKLHFTTLGDGTRPVGIHFQSKYLTGWCRAYWLSDINHWVVKEESIQFIARDHPALEVLTRRWDMDVL